MKNKLSLYKLLYLQAYYFLKKTEFTEDNDRYFSVILLISMLESFLVIGSIIFMFLIFGKISLFVSLFEQNICIFGLIAIILLVVNYLIFIKSGCYIDIIKENKEQTQKRLLLPFFFLLCLSPYFLSLLIIIFQKN